MRWRRCSIAVRRRRGHRELRPRGETGPRGPPPLALRCGAGWWLYVHRPVNAGLSPGPVCGNVTRLVVGEPTGPCETPNPMDDETEQLLKNVTRRPPATPEALERLAVKAQVALPEDYRAFMVTSDGGEGDVGETWLELWPVQEIEHVLGLGPPIYEDVVLFAGDGANVVYGFDRSRQGEIVEGDWIGLGRDELIQHGRTFVAFLRSIGHG